jgi:hypothetical protein
MNTQYLKTPIAVAITCLLLAACGDGGDGQSAATSNAGTSAQTVDATGKSTGATSGSTAAGSTSTTNSATTAATNNTVSVSSLRTSATSRTATTTATSARTAASTTPAASSTAAPSTTASPSVTATATPTASSNPVVSTGAVNSVNEIVNDMALLNDLPLNGAPSGPGWARGPGVVVMGNNPRGSATPGYWQPSNGTYKGSTLWNGILPWMVLFDGQGNGASNTRVQMRNVKIYYRSRSNGSWQLIGSTTGVDGSLYSKDLMNAYGSADIRAESDGVSVMPGNNNGFFHGWWTAGQKSIAAVAGDIDAIFVTMQARLIIGPAGYDDRSSARYLLQVGADYYPEVGMPVTSSGPLGISWLPGVGVSRAKLITNEWRSFNMASIDAANQDVAGNAMSTAVFRSAPPPLD